MSPRDYKILSELIVNDAIVELSQGDYGNKQVILTEKDSETSYSVKIHSIPDTVSVFVFKSDIFPPPKEIFKNNNNECKRADYIILVEQEESKYQGKYAIFLELKSGNPSDGEIIHQLKGSLGLFKYCRTIGEIFLKEKDFLKDYKFCFVAIKNIPKPKFNKRTTRPKKQNHLAPQPIPIQHPVSYIPTKMIKLRYEKKFQFKDFFNCIVD